MPELDQGAKLGSQNTPIQTRVNIHRKFETPGNFSCPKGVEKNELFSQETCRSQNFRNETLKSHLLKQKCAPLTSFRV